MGSELIDPVRVSKSKSKAKSFPPGFRFHPTDEELILYYLKRKICRRSLKLDIIGEVDVYKWDPEELPGQSKLKTGDRQWFFFSPRERKYPNGGRSSRATMNGYWKATGKDRIIKRKSSSAGIKKTLVYYQGRAPAGQRTDWVMHEYTMDEEELKRCRCAQDHYVLYKIFKKSGPGPKNGEQYGAPFVEEEWSDNDDCLDIDALLINKKDPIVNDLRNVREEEENMLSSDIIEFLNKIIDEPEVLPPLPEILEKNENCLIENSSSKVVDDDFLEMDDLIGPEPGNCGLERLGFPDFDDSFSGFDLVNHDNEVHDELPISYDLWNHDHGESSITTHGAFSHQSSGVVIQENHENPEFYINQSPETNMIDDDDGTNSWFSSALWSFVDSIPTTPASASESSALVNRAFERMSSFGRGKNLNIAAAAAAASGTTACLKRSKPLRSSRGIVYFSILGVLFAILWVFVGSSFELLGRFVWW